MSVCISHGLNPILRQIHAVKYEGRVVFQVGIDGFRLQAERTGLYKGQLGPYWCGEDGEWRDVWLSDDPPVAARVGVYKESAKNPNTGEYLPFWGIAKFNSFAKWFRDKQGKKYLGAVWAKSGDNQLAKCAEAQALRKAFPAETSALHIKEEAWDEETANKISKENAEAGQPTGKPTVKMPESTDSPAEAEVVEPTKATTEDEQIYSQIVDLITVMQWNKIKTAAIDDMIKKFGVSVAFKHVRKEYEQWEIAQSTGTQKENTAGPGTTGKSGTLL